MGHSLRTSIQLKLTAFVAGVMVVAAVAFSLTSYVFVRRTLHDQINERLVVMASDRQKLLLRYIQQQEERVNLVASRRLWRDYLAQLADGQSPSEKLRNDTQQSLLDALNGVPGLQAVWITDLAGHVLLATDPAVVGRDLSQSPEFKAGLTGTAFLLEEDDPTDDTITVTAPAILSSNRVVGVVFVVVDQTPMVSLLKDRTGMGETGEVMLGIRRGENVQYLLEADPKKYGMQKPVAEVPAMVAAIAGRSGFMQTKDYRGTEVLAAFRPVGYHDWGLVTKMDVAEAYAPINVLRRMFILVEIIVIGVGLLVTYWLAKQFSRPILHLADMAGTIASGAVQAQVIVESNDEVGQLARAFNRMGEEVSHSYAILEDRVHQRTAELQAERDLLQGFLDHTPDIIYFKDLQSRFVRVNKTKALKCGQENPAALIGKTDFDFFSEEHAQQAFDDEQRIIRTGQPIIGLEERETWPDGHVTWVSSTKVPLRDKDGQIIGTFGISRDITDRKRAEEELNRYFSLSPDMFCIADYRGYFRRVNTAWSTVLGYTAEELQAEPFINFVHPDDRTATLAEFDRILKGARALHFENRYRCKDGSYRWLQWNAIPLAQEQVIHAVARDVSDYKRAQELLTRFADALNKKNLEMQEDLKMAREVHQVFVPHDYPLFPRGVSPDQNALRFVYRYLPTSALGGDFFDILQLSDTQAGIFICDVMGHGMRAALVTSIIRGLVDKYRDYATDPGQFLTQINLALLTNLQSVTATIFATAAYVVIDLTTGRILCANAGHPNPLLLRSAARQVEQLNGTGPQHPPALGLMKDAVYPTTSHGLGVRDSVLLFTDGIFEVEARDGQEFGLARLEEVVRQHVTAPGVHLLDELLLETRKYSASGEFADDVCLVSVQLTRLIGAKPGNPQ